MNKKYTLELVKSYFEEQGCELLEKEYKNCKIKMEYKCSCGNISKICFDNFKQGQRCYNCRGKKIAKKLKFTLGYIEQFFEEHGCKLLEKEYINNSTKMKYICSCGNISKISFANFQQGYRCKKCGTKRATNKTRCSLEHIEQYFKDHGCELMEKEYIKNSVKMRYRCKCENISEISFASFRKGSRCIKCSGSEKHTYKFVKQYFKDQGCELLEKEYKNNHYKMKYKCECGNISKISLNCFKKGQRCRKCANKKQSGKNNPNYNPNLTDENRKKNRMNDPLYHIWRTEVYGRDYFACQKCIQKGVYLNAHHIKNYSINKELRLDIDNGITFCLCCHKKFHKIYGRKNNTKEQLKEFLKTG